MFKKSIILFFIFYFCNNIHSQNCNNCNQNNIINGDFETFNAACVAPSNRFFGNNFFAANCVNNWSDAIQSADLITPLIEYVNLSPLINSNMAGICIPGFEAFISNGFNNDIINDPEFNYSLNFDLAAACVANGGNNFNAPLGNIPLSSLDVSLVSGNTVDLIQSVPITNNENITFGTNTICIDPIPLIQGTYSQVQFQALPNAANNGHCWALIDNVDMFCHLNESLFDISYSYLGDNTYQFVLESDPLTYPITSFTWDFGDGTIVSGGSVIQHTFQNPNLQPEISCYIENSLSCCATITQPLIIMFDCDGTVFLQGTSELDDLVRALSLNDLTDLESAVSDVAIDGTFEINDDVTFGSELNFLLTEGSSIIVNSGRKLTKTGGFIGPCDEMFEGVILLEEASIDLDLVRIYGANTALSLQENSILNAVNCMFEDSNTGILVTGEADIQSFIGNTIDNCDFGLNANKAVTLNIDGPNSFLNCEEMGIRYFKTAGRINNNTFNNCKFGVFLFNTNGHSIIENNTIDAIEAGIAMIQGRIALVRFNRIGENSPALKYGVYSDFVSMNVSDNPIIKASYQGISVYHPIGLSVFSNPDIQVDVDDNLGDKGSGIFTWKGGFANIASNTVSGSNMQGCVFLESSSEKVIHKNELYDGDNHGIVIAGGEGLLIGNNEIFGTPDNGIGIYSANGCVIGSNDIRSKNLGLLVSRLSQTQTIFCNDFLTAGVADIRTSSVLGPHFHANNEFRVSGSFAQTVGLNTNQARASRFTVDPCNSSANLCSEPEDWSLDNFFRVEQYDPTNTENPPITAPDCMIELFDSEEPDVDLIPTGDPDHWCWLLTEIEASKDIDNRKFWIERYKALKLNALRNGELIPDPCIQCNCIPDEDCGIVDLIEIEESVEQVIADAMDNNSDFFEEVVSNIELIIDELDEVDCNNETFNLYRSTYRILLKDMVNLVLGYSEIEEIRNTADLCPDIYGDVVFWARGILSHRADSYRNDVFSCNTGGEELIPRSKTNILSDDVLITPNPANNFITIDNKTTFDELKVRIFDIHGQSYIIKGILEKSLKLNCSNFPSGIYFVNISHNSGYTVLQKVVINH